MKKVKCRKIEKPLKNRANFAKLSRTKVKAAKLCKSRTKSCEFIKTLCNNRGKIHKKICDIR